MKCTAKNDVKRGCVDNEHAETCATEDTREVIVVGYNLLSKRESELGFDGEDLRS